MPPHGRNAAAARRPHLESMSRPVAISAPDLIGVAVVDADPLAREGLRAIIAGEDNLSLLQETAQVNSILARASGARPDVIFVEAGLASEDAGAAIRTLRRSLPHARVIAFGLGNREEEVFHVFEAGAIGYVVRTAIR